MIGSYCGEVTTGPPPEPARQVTAPFPGPGEPPGRKGAQDGYRAAGKAGRDRPGGTTVKAGARRAGNADAPDGRQDLAGALIRGQDLAGGVDTGTGPGRGIAAGQDLAGHLCLAGARRGIYIVGPEVGPRIITTRGVVAENTDRARIIATL